MSRALLGIMRNIPVGGAFAVANYFVRTAPTITDADGIYGVRVVHVLAIAVDAELVPPGMYEVHADGEINPL
jgi:hypothetical protein